MGDPSEIKAVAMECGVKPGAAIDEKHGVVDGVFLAEFSKECMRKNVGSRRFKLCME